MKAGKCRHYATLQQKVVTQVNSRGWGSGSGVPDPWQVIATDIPVEIITLSGREAEIASQIVPSADQRIRLRFIPEITNATEMPFQRFICNNRTFNVVWVNNVEQRNRELVCLCEEKFK